LLRGRVPSDREEYVGRHFPSGESRDAARRLWQLLEDDLGIELSDLHPDDDLEQLLSSTGSDSLGTVQFVMALEEGMSSPRADDAAGRLGSFRECVKRMVRAARLDIDPGAQ